MANVRVDIDEEACAEVMRRFGLVSKSEAINFALRRLAIRPATLEEVEALEGSGWEGNLDEMRSSEGRIL
ncbi:MAG: type II toxin-antitoxin system VapB family antitoxin [Dehalococcoidia bacterium]|nr:type II toxin-antitoxin system VapB family antitoxin [Dehalococcoidia bacterium]